MKVELIPYPIYHAARVTWAKTIPLSWETGWLGECSSAIQTGPFGSQLHASDYVPVGVPSIMPTNIGENRIVEDGIVRITEEDMGRIVGTYHDWRHDVDAMLKDGEARGILYELAPGYSDIPGFCKSATTAEIAAHGHVLTPGRYVGAEEVEDDGELFEDKMARLTAELKAQFAESAMLEAAIRNNLKGLGYAF